MVKPKYQQTLPTEITFKNDLDYIRDDIVAKQVNGLYCKVSKILKCITVVNITKENYIRYWVKLYEKDKAHPERVDQIREAIINKLENGLTPLEEVIKIQKASSDPIDETKKLIKEITKEAKPDKLVDIEDEEEEDE